MLARFPFFEKSDSFHGFGVVPVFKILLKILVSWWRGGRIHSMLLRIQNEDPTWSEAARMPVLENARGMREIPCTFGSVLDFGVSS